ncbi:glycosyltransferase [Argonema antarcticum]|uniref:glycosyltransferase n=1 Tax=Argonema antarcticum TaxID=2942763 RepID=UPI0020125A5D|nr:glycosyltransferase [Argonema antarcticum]MCL1471488.1 glycosyltransferase [Argonema antarcticum A004/B2]
MPLISVIIPVYNGEKTIRATIESVLKQSLKDYELIIINDGSQDGTLEVISQIQDSRLQVFSYSNSGVSVSRNRGVENANGEFIAFLDADDLWTPDKLQAQWQALQENPEAAVAYSWTDWITEAGEFLRPGSHITANGDVYEKLLLINFLDNGSNPLIRKQALLKVGGFDALLPPAEDWDMWLRLAAKYPFVAVPFPQVLYRVSANSASANVSRLALGSLHAIKKAFDQAPASLQYLKPYSLSNIYKYLTYKALEGFPERKKGLAGARFLWSAVRNDLSLLKTRIIWKAVFKIAAMIIMPPQQAALVLTKLSKFSDLNTLLTQIRLNP